MAVVGKGREDDVVVMVLCYCLVQMIANRDLDLLLLVQDLHDNSRRMGEILLQNVQHL